MRLISAFVISLVYSEFYVNSQVIFEDEPEPTTPRRQFDKNNIQVVITLPPGTFRRPSQQFQQQQQQQQQFFQRPNNNNNNGFGSQQDFNSNNGFQGGQQGGFPSSGNNNNFQDQSGFQKQNELVVASSRSSDCQTWQNTDGFCTPLTACGRIARVIQNRPPFVAARILRRSICGFSGVVPSVCCPTGRQGQGQPPPQPASNNNNNFGGGDFNKNGNNNNNNNKPGFEFGNNGGGNNNNGPGLVIIPPPATTPLTTTTTTTTTTPFPIQIIQQPTKKPVGSTPGGLIIGDGPIALLPAQSGDDSSPAMPFSEEGLPDDCGFSPRKSTRIVGGKPAEKGAWPWIAALGYKDEAGNVNYLCGGALISPNYVVTAAHCLHGRDDLASVRLGDHDIFSTSDNVQPLELEVDKRILHPKYDPSTFKNDIALLRLKRSVQYSLQIHPICLPNTPKLRNERFENTQPFVTGWGAIQFNGPSSSVLREVQVPTVPDSVCQEKYSSFKTAVVDDTNICAGLQAGGKDACQGDSGGPLQFPVGPNRYVLIGVVSFGFKCADPGFPGIYTRVTSHLDWIQDTIQQQ